MEKSAGRTIVLLAKRGSGHKKVWGAVPLQSPAGGSGSCVSPVNCVLWQRGQKNPPPYCSTFYQEREIFMYRSWSWTLTVVYLSLTLLEQGGKRSRLARAVCYSCNFWLIGWKLGCSSQRLGPYSAYECNHKLFCKCCLWLTKYQFKHPFIK